VSLVSNCVAILGAALVVELGPSPDVVSGRSANCEVTLSHFVLASPQCQTPFLDHPGSSTKPQQQAGSLRRWRACFPFFPHELGSATQTGVRYRCRSLPPLRGSLENYCRHPKSIGHYQDPWSSGLANPPSSLRCPAPLAAQPAHPCASVRASLPGAHPLKAPARSLDQFATA
jgi:hypothetical protein